MKKISVLSGIVIFCAFITTSYAQLATVVKPSFPPINWQSKSPSDEVKIDNGNGTPIEVQITVTNTSAEDSSTIAPGINVKNCGSTTHLDAGSSAICQNSDPKNPITFSADSNDVVTGTYEIK